MRAWVAPFKAGMSVEVLGSSKSVLLCARTRLLLLSNSACPLECVVAWLVSGKL